MLLLMLMIRFSFFFLPSFHIDFKRVPESGRASSAKLQSSRQSCGSLRRIMSWAAHARSRCDVSHSSSKSKSTGPHRRSFSMSKSKLQRRSCNGQQIVRRWAVDWQQMGGRWATDGQQMDVYTGGIYMMVVDVVTGGIV